MSRFADYRAVERLGQTAVAIGNFDGVHIGHRALLARVVAKKPALIPSVLTFSPHPVRVLAPHVDMPMVCTLDDRMALLEAAGAELILAQHFDRTFASQSPSEFIEQVLVESLGVGHLVVGYDFEFGRNRAGNRETLVRAGEHYGFTVDVVKMQRTGTDLVASSSQVRSLVRAGDLKTTAAILGRPFHLNGRVIHGAQRGRTIGFPTANMDSTGELFPALGVYSGWLDFGQGPAPAVINLGRKPTVVADGATSLEVHVLDATDLDLYGLDCRVFFDERLRDEMTFDGIESLRSQIERDAALARDKTAALPLPRFP